MDDVWFDGAGEISLERFLAGYWQRRPLLLRGATSAPLPCRTRTEIVELATRPGVDARKIDRPTGTTDWRLERGPFDRAAFDATPGDVGWTVLVQEADRHVAALAALLERFRFVPNWRLDDVMVSYATDGGGVGPHVDRYDVFLIQAAGTRRWRIGGEAIERPELRADTAYPVLAAFVPDSEHVLEPGDVLYLPPGFAHDGVAVGECVTISIGFRVPDPRELYGAYLRELGPEAYRAVRFGDAGMERPRSSGEIARAARATLREGGHALFDRPGEFDRFVGRHLTRPLRGAPPAGDPALASIERLAAAIDSGATLSRSAPAHFAWIADDAGAVWLYVGGEEYPLDDDGEHIAELLCGRTRLDRTSLADGLTDAARVAILVDLLLRGYLTIRPPECA